MIDWTHIDTVLLDMDGTLLDLHFDHYFWTEHLPRRYAELKQLPLADVQAQLMQRIMAARGSLQWYCTDYWSEQLQVDIFALKQEVDHLVAIRPHVLPFLAALQRSHRHTMIVTNAHKDSVAIKMQRHDLRPLLDDLVISHDYQLPKEDPEFWRQLQHDYPFDPDRTLLIDDTEAVLVAAARFGIKHLLTLLQPNSREPLRAAGRFAAFHHFDEIMPPEALP